MLKIWKPIVFIVGFALMIGLIVSWIALLIGFILAMPFATFVFGNPLMGFIGVANAFFLIALPIIGFIQFAARYVFKKKTTNRLTRPGMITFWVLNVVSIFAIGSFLGRDFNQEGEIAKQVQEFSIGVDTVQLKMGVETSKSNLINLDGATIVDDNLVIENIVIDFGKSKDDKFHVVQTHFSRGRNSKEIEKLAEAITYEPQVIDNEIIFPSNFSIQKGSKFRAQKVKLKLEVPEGKTVKFGKTNNNDFQKYISSHARWERTIPTVHWNGEHIWTMQENGFYSKADATQEIGDNLDFSDFKKIIIKGGVKVNITKGDAYDVKLSGKEHQLKKVTMEQMGEILDINSTTNGRSNPIHLHITAPDLERIDLENTDDVKITGFDGKKLDVINEGRSEVKVFVEVDSLYLNFRRNKSDIRGKGKYLKVKLGGGARMDAEHYTAENAYVNATSSGKIRLEVTDTLRTDLSNGSRMAYDENPRILIDERQVRQQGN